MRGGGGEQNGESLSIGVERQPGLGLGSLSVENKRNRVIVGGCFLVCIFLKMHQQAAALAIRICIFCHLHELIGARRELTVASARMRACVPGRAARNLPSKIKTQSKQSH